MKAIYLLGSGSFERIYGPPERAELEKMLEFVAPPLEGKDLPGVPNETLAGVEVIVSGWGMPKLTGDILARMPALKLVLYGAGSVRGFVTPEMWDRSVRVVSAWAANAVPVAEFTFAAVTFALKSVFRAARAMKSNRGARPGVKPAGAPAGAFGSTVGIVSLGMIGRLVREKLRGLEVSVVAYDPFVTPADAAKLEVDLVPLEEVFRRSDVVSLHTPWLKETVGMIRKEHFLAMKEGASFINTARGAVVDEPGMIDALRERPDIEALLDVTYPEPPAADSPFYDLPNVTLTPHIAGSMGGECRRMGQYVIEELRRYQAGEPLRFEIDRVKAETMA